MVKNSLANLEILCIIPARGGSKGIPRKNLQILAGKPLLIHSLDNAKNSKYINRIIVSTDDGEIASLVVNNGCEFVNRPKKISGDRASSEEALLHVLRQINRSESYEPDVIVFLQCTSPLISSKDIDDTIEIFLNENADSALTVAPFHHFLWKREPNGDLVGINHDKLKRLRRQDIISHQYIETGAVYILNREKFTKYKHRFFGRIAINVLPKEKAVEIDNIMDFQIAEILLKNIKTKEKFKRFPKNLEAVIFDFDGVFTDNKVWVMDNGKEAVMCDRSDGMGINLLRSKGIDMIVLSKETSPVIAARCLKLGLIYYQGLVDKADVLKSLAKEKKYSLKNIIYLGNDINDIGCMNLVGYAVAVADAYPTVVDQADLVLTKHGGHGAIRELCDLILKHL